MDNWCMDVWVDEVLSPYIALISAHITHIIFLDSYCCHMIPTAISRIKDVQAKFSISQEDVPQSASPSTWASIRHSRASFCTVGQNFWSSMDFWMAKFQSRKEFRLLCGKNKHLTWGWVTITWRLCEEELILHGFINATKLAEKLMI